MKVGWLQASADPSEEIGNTEKSFAFDGLYVSDPFYPLTERFRGYSNEPGICPSVCRSISCPLYNLKSIRNILMILQLCRTGHDNMPRTKMRALALILFELSPLSSFFMHIRVRSVT